MCFFPAVYVLYLLLRRNCQAQNLLLLLASYIFYGYWDWRFLSLLASITLLNYGAAQSFEHLKGTRIRQGVLAVAVAMNLSVLGIFKYLNFFADNFVQLLHLFGVESHGITLKVLLPVGISFFTFQALGYLIDVYQGRLKASRSILDFALFVAFFPQLVAGPIERAGNLLPQIAAPRRVNASQANMGISLILWGYFKKVVIADHLAYITDPVFSNYLSYQGLDLVIAAIAFTFQIYCDFSAYSAIARGLAKLLGIELMVNFRLPYFSLDPQEFWRRWHISLSTWLRDYLYIPLGGGRGSRLSNHRNLGITMVLCGLWHGAAWNFIFWGAYHWALLSVHRVFREQVACRTSNNENSKLGIPLKTGFMFVLSLVGWVIFRSGTLSQAGYMLGHMGFSCSAETEGFLRLLVFFLAPLLVVESVQYFGKNLAILAGGGFWRRSLVYGALLAGILAYGVRDSAEFIYFQF